MPKRVETTNEEPDANQEHEETEPKPVPPVRTLPKPMTRPELEALRKKLRTKFH